MYWEDWRNVIFLLIAVGLMIGLVLFARGDFDPFLEDNPFTSKPAAGESPPTN